MAVQMLPQNVADAFVKQYYFILGKSPENAHKFYQEPSLLGWPRTDGVMTIASSLKGINEKIMASAYKNCLFEVKTTDAQQSVDGGVIVAVTGLSTGTDNVKRNFSQTFFLAKQTKGYFVMNDILRFSEVCEPIKETAAAKVDKVKDQPAPSVQISAPKVISVKPSSSPKKTVEKHAAPRIISEKPLSSPKKAVENGKAKELIVISPPKQTTAKDASTPLVASLEKPSPVVAQVSNVKVEPKKISYASMVAKDAAPTSPKTATSNLRVATPTKSSAPTSDGPQKVSTPKAPAKLATPSYGAPNASAYGEARGIYIGRLPYDITKQGIAEVMKQFGTVRRNSDTIQIRRHEDGFCCGFLEFESADAAHRAVEAHHVYFGDKEAYITYKRSSYNRGNDGGGRSPTRGGYQNGEVNNNGRFQNENRDGYSKGGARGSHRNY